MGTVNLRNLEQIQEADVRRGGLVIPTLLLSTVAAATLLGTLWVAWQDRDTTPPAPPDPLAALVAEARAEPAPESTELTPSEATFGAVLSGALRPTTAYAAVSAAPRVAADVMAEPTPLLDDPLSAALGTLPVVPLPAGDLVGPSVAVTSSPDPLTRATVVLSTPTDGELGASGSVGGYQVQVGAFTEVADAQQLVRVLRLRKHRAHIETALVHERTWYRVRVGGFERRELALEQQRVLAEQERLRPFLVAPPPKVKASGSVLAQGERPAPD